jgi:GTP-binding protein EngB required for normal cell division
VVLCSVGNRVKIIDAFTKMKETSYILFPSNAFRRKNKTICLVFCIILVVVGNEFLSIVTKIDKIKKQKKKCQIIKT